VDDSERKDNARTKNNKNFCGQDAPPILPTPAKAASSLPRTPQTADQHAKN
jgi:hypothetical protein